MNLYLCSGTHIVKNTVTQWRLVIVNISRVLSIIKTSTFKKLLLDSEQVTITPNPNTFIVSVTGQETPVIGSTTIFLTFNGQNNVTNTFRFKVYIHDDVEYDLLLGWDFTGSNAKVNETPNTMYFSNLNNPPKPFETYWKDNLHLCCQVPLIKDIDASSTYQLYLTEETTLLPMSLTNIKCKLKQIPLIPLQIGNETPFTISHISDPLRTMDNTMFSFNNTNHISIPVYNDSFEDIDLTYEHPFASIQLLSFFHEIIPVSLSKLSFKDFQLSEKLHCNNTSFLETITYDETITEQERETAFFQYSGAYFRHIKKSSTGDGKVGPHFPSPPRFQKLLYWCKYCERVRWKC